MKWNRGHAIGHGSTSTVSLATVSGEIFAVKSSELSRSEPLQREEKILSSLCYPNPHVVSYKGCDITKENEKFMYNLFMEYMPFGTLSQHGGMLDEQAIVCYTRQVVKGLAHLHSKGLVHCDIKGANIMIGEDGAKIGDFGCAKSVNEAAAPIRGTPVFMAPEVARGEEQEFSSDIWSLGCTIIEMATGSSPWPNVDDPISTLYHIAYSNDVPQIPCFLSNQAKDFLGKCLRRNPKERFSASQLLKHPFLGELLCSNDKQVLESNSISPTSILDQCFWSSMEESQSLSFCSLIHTTSFENSLVDDRIKRLAGEPCLAWWHDDHDDENWITIRGNEVDGFCNCGSEIGSPSDELVKSSVKDRISGHFCNDHTHICRVSSFVGSNVNFHWNEKNQLLLGIRRASRPQTVMPSSVLSSDSMHLGLLAAAAHAAATNSRFTIFYNPRACPSEFVIPLAKYVKAVYHTRVSVGMRFRMLFETEESSVRRYMGTITGICDLDSVRWPNSHWRSVKVGWDESTAGERQPRVSLWEIEPLTTFPMYPSPFPLRLKRPWPPGLPSFHGMKDDDFGMSSPLMWLRDTDRGLQSLNYQGIGVNPWMQPRFDPAMLNMQTDMYQAVAAAALQDMRTVVDPSKQLPGSLLQFQQPPNFPNRTAALMQAQMLQQSQPQQAFQNNNQENQNLSQSQPQAQTNPQQHQHSFNNQLHHHNQQQQQTQQQVVDNNQQISGSVSTMSQFVSATQPQSPPPMQALSSLCHQQSFSDSNVNSSTTIVSPLHSIMGSSFPHDESSHLMSLPRTSSWVPVQNSTGWPSKRIAVDPLLSSGASQCILPQVEQLGQARNSMSQNAITLPPFPGRECSIDQEGSNDPQSNLLFGVNIDPSSLLLHNGMSNFKGISGNTNDSSTMSYHQSSSYMNTAGADSSLNHGVTPSIGESGFLHTQENGEQGNNPLNKTFVKVYKSGSFGRSLDITKFSSYNELRSELARMFGLEGELEDPVRSGWQLVFVDRENDVLLLGDGPWPEFVNSVWCIKILSPEEVQQMGNTGLGLLNSVPIQRLSNSICDDYVSRQDSRNLSSGITTVGSLDY